jgi:hypothetical protein
MSVNLKRILTKDEQVDHKDGNKLNDEIGNLQILTLAENVRKMVVEQNKSAKPVKHTCTFCKIEFERDARNSNWRIKKGYKFYCSKTCANNGLRKFT